MDRDLNLALEQLKRSDEITSMEEDQKEQAYVDLKIISLSLSAYKDELDKV